jgi:ATP-dependent RNA helicase DeaD
MTTEFNQLNLNPLLVQAITELGYEAPTPIQEAVIPVMLSGSDVLGQAQTGTGKTAAFSLPVLNALSGEHRAVQCLVVVPTRELAMQVAGAIQSHGQLMDVRVLAVYGGQAYGPQIHQIKRGMDIIVGTPGRLIDLLDRDILDIQQVRTVVLDEADEMLSMGFIEDIETILARTPAERQTALFSATLSPEIRRLAERYMHSPKEITIQREHMTVETVEQRYYLVPAADKTAALTRLFESEEITSALIFARTRVTTGELAHELTSRGFPAEALSGDLSQEARERTLERFRQNKITVLVATDVAARGLDIDNISHVFNFDLPEDPEIYVHRIGRTGRAGKTGVAISLFSPSERRYLGRIEHFSRQKMVRATLPSAEEILKKREDKLIKQVTTWLQRGRCKKERELVENMVAEGFDALDVAAVALKLARAEEKQRPIASVGEVAEPRSRERERGTYERREAFTGGRDRRDSRSNSNNRSEGGRAERGTRRERPVYSNEPGMVRLSVNVGRDQGIRPNDLVGTIAYFADIPGSVIGKIKIEDQRSWVDVPEKFVSTVLNKTRTAMIRRQPIEIQLA